MNVFEKVNDKLNDTSKRLYEDVLKINDSFWIKKESHN